MKGLTVAGVFLCCAAVLETGCGGGNLGGQASPVESHSLATLKVACASVSGQRTESPYFVGQNLKCSATADGVAVTPSWTSTAGTIDSSGQLSRVPTPATVFVTALYGPQQVSANLEFVSPVGAPGMIFATPIDSDGFMWDFVLDSKDQMFGAGWTGGTLDLNAKLYSMDIWTRKPTSVRLANPSMLTAGALSGARVLFAGGNVSASSYKPLVVSADSTPRLLGSGACEQSGVLSALTFDSETGEMWGAWSGDSKASRIRIDQASFQPNCGSAQTLEESSPTETRVPWVWNLHASKLGMISSGHFTSSQTKSGFITTIDHTGTIVANREFPNLLDVRVTPEVEEGGAVYYYLAGHDIAANGDVWTVKKIDQSLEDVWTRQLQIAPGGKNEPYAIVVNPNGGVIVAGMATQLFPRGGEIELTDAVLVALDSNGNNSWGPVRLNPSTSGTDTCLISNIHFVPGSAFLVAAASCSGTKQSSFVLGFAMPSR